MNSSSELNFDYDITEGDGIQHNYVGEMQCEQCGQDMRLVLKVHQQTEGFVDYYHIDPTGGELVGTPTIKAKE